MEYRLQDRFQVPADHLLGDAIGHRWHAQRPRPVMALRDVHPTHRRRHVAAGRQSVPELVEVGGESGLEVLDRLSVYPSRSLAGLHALEGFPDLPLRDGERLCLCHAAPPVTGWPLPQAGCHGPFGPAPLQCLQPYYGPFCPCAPHRYSGPGRDCPLGRLPWHRDDRFSCSM